jgi:hypothetical protein
VGLLSSIFPRETRIRRVDCRDSEGRKRAPHAAHSPRPNLGSLEALVDAISIPFIFGMAAIRCLFPVRLPTKLARLLINFCELSVDRIRDIAYGFNASLVCTTFHPAGVDVANRIARLDARLSGVEDVLVALRDYLQEFKTFKESYATTEAAALLGKQPYIVRE